MALYRTEAIVLGYRNLGEADKILTLFSPDKGKIHAVARGVRRPRNPLLGGSQLFSYSNFLIMEGRNLDNISQCEIKESFYKIRQKLEPMSYGLYFAELLRASTPMEDKNRELFRFFLKTMYVLQDWQNLEILSRIYEIKLMAIQGFKPEIQNCVECGERVQNKVFFSASMGGVLCSSCFQRDKHSVTIAPETLIVLKNMLIGTYEELMGIQVKDHVLKELENISKHFISYHIDRKLKTTEFIKDVNRLKINRGL
ncbi:MAG: DNA repair protein RecO [Firmicutes bacterium]|nr:DNA repair protein RecO [Bacillota bacterium]